MNPKFDCVYCKGRFPEKYCQKTYCPILQKTESMFKVKDSITNLDKNDFSSQSPAVFVDRFSYPNVNVGILAPPEKKENINDYDAPRDWATNNLKIPEVVDFRSSLINSRFRSNVKITSISELQKNSPKTTTKFLDQAQEISMSDKAVDIELNLQDRPNFRLNVDAYTAPTGPNASLNKVDITSNPSIPTNVDNIVSDTDLLSNQGINILFKKGYDENFLSKLLSVGNLGIEKNRRLVPTRWAITAVDDNVGKDIIKEIKDYNETEPIMTFGGYLGNYYMVLLLPGTWSYELFELYLPNASFNLSDTYQFSTDYESWEGRKNYADNTAGGYYAARLPILEYLKKNKIQASCLVFRFITGEYTVPLGVWVVREATRKSIAGKRMEFVSKDDMLLFAKKLAKLKFNYDLDVLIRQSKLLKNFTKQTRLKNFFSL